MKKKNEKSCLTDKQITELGKTLAEAIRIGMKQKSFEALDVKEAIELIGTLIQEKTHYYDYLSELQKKHREDFAHSKKYFQKKTKEGDKSVKGIVKILDSYESDALISLYRFLKELPRRTSCNSIFKRIVAEAKRTWSSPSYIVTNVLNGTKQELVAKETKAYRTIALAVKKTKKAFGDKNRLLSLDGVVSVSDGDHYIAFVSGGNNGWSNWEAYFQSLTMIVKECKDAWLIEIKNDCCDDVHYALIGFRVGTSNTKRKDK